MFFQGELMAVCDGSCGSTVVGKRRLDALNAQPPAAGATAHDGRGPARPGLVNSAFESGHDGPFESASCALHRRNHLARGKRPPPLRVLAMRC